LRSECIDLKSSEEIYSALKKQLLRLEKWLDRDGYQLNPIPRL